MQKKTLENEPGVLGSICTHEGWSLTKEHEWEFSFDMEILTGITNTPVHLLLMPNW